VNVATLEDPRLDGGRADGAGQLNGALAIIAQALGAPCELAWLTGTGELECIHSRALAEAPSWDWLGSADAVIPVETVVLRSLEGKLLGGVFTGDCGATESLRDFAPHLARLLGIVLADQERFAAYEALIELTSQLHADEINADEILRLIVDRARRLIGVDVSGWA
jgi:hypothetical protein